jgi:hypothetical protein
MGGRAGGRTHCSSVRDGCVTPNALLLARRPVEPIEVLEPLHRRKLGVLVPESPRRRCRRRRLSHICAGPRHGRAAGSVCGVHWTHSAGPHSSWRATTDVATWDPHIFLRRGRIWIPALTAVWMHMCTVPGAEVAQSPSADVPVPLHSLAAPGADVAQSRAVPHTAADEHSGEMEVGRLERNRDDVVLHRRHRRAWARTVPTQ